MIGVPQSVVDGPALRAALTAAARECGGDETALRLRATHLLKEAYAEGERGVRERLDAGAGGLETARALSMLADDIVSAAYDVTSVHMHRARNPTEGERLAVCAVGGYGRGERAPGSDIDLLFLRAYKSTPWSESVVETMLYVLWDMGLKVGHAVRTVDECVRIAKSDWTVLTSLMDLRRLAGDAELPVDLAGRIATEAFRGRGAAFIEAKLIERHERLVRQDASPYMVEPDVKEGAGGQRDLQLIEWLARGATFARVGAAPAARLFAAEEAVRYEGAAEFLWRVRCLMHFAAGRAQEKLTFDLQPEIARRMGFEDAGPEAAVEQFMRRYFLVVREIGALTSILCAKVDADVAKKRSGRFFGLFSSSDKIAPLADPDLAMHQGAAAFAEPAEGFRPLDAYMRLCGHAASRGVDVHPDAMAETQRRVEALSEEERADPAAAAAFFDAILDASSVEAALRLMNDSGLLGAYLPEFGRIVGRTQFNMYHHYTVDEHILRVVGALADLECGRPEEDAAFAAKAFKRVDERRALYLAALFHDVGKGLGDQEEEGAKLARIAADRLGLDEHETDLIAWLVAHHLLMSDVAQRRDLGDPQTIVDFLDEVRAPERLHMLCVLTIADIKGVGPGVWTPWKRRLLEDLYELSLASFHGGRASAAHARETLEERAEAARAALLEIGDAADPDFAARWAASLEDGYWLAFDEEAHRRHLRAAEAARGGEEVAAVWLQEQGAAELVVVCPDRLGLFSRVAGAIAGTGADVRGARIHTLADQTAFDLFTLAYPEQDDAALARTAAAVKQAVAANVPFDDAPAEIETAPRRARAFRVPASVAFDDEASETATVIEISGRDRRGLLADLARALCEQSVEVSSAHVESYGERAMDVFYALESDGSKITDDARRAAIRDALLAVLAEGDAEAPLAGGRRLARARASGLR